MRLLFDTHAFIWWDAEPAKLSQRVLRLCEDRSNQLIVSVASVWEMQIKQQLGKMKLTAPLSDLIEHQKHTNRVEILPINLAHVIHLRNLPLHHKDPFDRLLIVQAILEDALFLTNDPDSRLYPVKWIW